MKDTKIEWATHTFNPWIGCQKVSPGCKFCYAETLVNRFGGDFAKVRRITTDAYWQQPIQWNREAEKSGTRPRVFCASLADVFEDWTGPIHDSKGNRLANDFNGAFRPIQRLDVSLTSMNDVRKRLFELIDQTPNLDWLMLTKRPENIWNMWPRKRDAHPSRQHMQGEHCYRDNVWIGTTVENQWQADKRIPALMDCRELSPVLFLSCEPLLGPVNLTDVAGKIGIGLHSYDVLNGKNFHWDDGGCWTPCDTIDWVIVGGESGNEARPMHPEWAQDLRDQCAAAQVAFHFKQWGEWLPQRAARHSDLSKDASKQVILRPDGQVTSGFLDYGTDACIMDRVGKKAAGRLLDGRESNELPTGKRIES